MDTTTPAVSPLRQRMTEDMRMRKLEPRTQEAYIRAVRKLTVYLKRPPDTATVEDLRNFQLHLVDTGTSPITLNATPTGLKFFFAISRSAQPARARAFIDLAVQRLVDNPEYLLSEKELRAAARRVRALSS